MEKLILFFIILFNIIIHSQDSPILLKFTDLEGNLRDVNNLWFNTLDNAVLNVLGGKTSLTQTGAEVQAILDGAPEGNLTFIDDAWIGLGSAKGRIEFDDQSTDEINFLDARVGIGTSTPGVLFAVEGGNAEYSKADPVFGLWNTGRSNGAYFGHSILVNDVLSIGKYINKGITGAGIGIFNIHLSNNAVGIHTTTPDEALDVEGNLAISLANINMTNIKVVKVTKAHGDDLFDASATTDNATIWTQPVNSKLVGVIMRLETQFDGTAWSDLRVTMGLAGDNNGLLATTGNMTSDAEDTEYEDVGAYYDAFTEGVHGKTNATIAWIAYATSTGGDLDASTAGTMDFYFIYETP